MSTQSVNAEVPDTDATSETDSNAEVQVTGRNVEVPDHYRLEGFSRSISYRSYASADSIRVDVTVELENSNKVTVQFHAGNYSPDAPDECPPTNITCEVLDPAGAPSLCKYRVEMDDDFMFARFETQLIDA